MSDVAYALFVIAGGLLALALSGVVYWAAPRRSANRFLALLLFFEATAQLMVGAETLLPPASASRPPAITKRAYATSLTRLPPLPGPSRLPRGRRPRHRAAAVDAAAHSANETYGGSMSRRQSIAMISPRWWMSSSAVSTRMSPRVADANPMPAAETSYRRSRSCLLYTSDAADE